VGSVYTEFQQQLAGWRRQYAGRPDEEMIRLFLLALEREEIVSIGYRENILTGRLERMPVPEEVRQLIRHALLWAWKDEEMHTIYIRGAILKLGRPLLRLRAYQRQLAGAVAGWSSSVRQHSRWSDAPFSRALAAVVTSIGSVTGQVPKDVREYLRYRPFRDFCLFNVDAELTAWLCWSRIVELAGNSSKLSPRLFDDFRRIASDDDRHRRIFEILSSSLDERDHLLDGVTADSLAERIGAVGEFFLPRSRRSTSLNDNMLGSGGRVDVMQGRSFRQKLPLFDELLMRSDLAGALERRARKLGKRIDQLRVAIKPTFMLGYHRRDRSIITDPELIDRLALHLRELGCADVAVVEGRNIYDRFYRNRSVAEVARYFGIGSHRYHVVDASEEQVPHAYFRGMAQYTIGATWKDADFRISFAKMRSHPIELAHLTVANVEWIGARCDEFIFAERQAERQTAIMMLLDEFPPHFSIIDAYDQAADGLLGVMGCPHPQSPMRLYAGADALAVDMTAARHMGISDPHDSSILRAACHWFGDPSSEIEVIGTDEPLRTWRGPYHNELSTLLSLLAFPVYVLGSGRGALFVPQMDQESFPLDGPEGFTLRIGRRAMQRLLGLHHST
jgi:uncharacterized protein (DUF362 family)